MPKYDIEKVRELRESGYTQKRIAEILGASTQTIYRHCREYGIKTKEQKRAHESKQITNRGKQLVKLITLFQGQGLNIDDILNAVRSGKADNVTIKEEYGEIPKNKVCRH